MKKLPIKNCHEFALVDDEDYERLKHYTWHKHIKQKEYKYFCVARWITKNKKSSHSFLHHEVIGKPPIGLVTDHIDGNNLNNTKKNLRFVTPSQNQMNRKKGKGSSKFKGVFFSQNKWKVTIQAQHKRYFLGYYHSEIEAAMAYNKAAIRYFGEYARLNKITPPRAIN